MFKTKRYAVMVLTDLLLVISLILLVGFIIPNPIREQSRIPLFVWLTVVGVFIVLSVVFHLASFHIVEKIKKRIFVGFTTKGDRIVGLPAKNQMVTNPKNTVYSIKRFIGHRYSELAGEAKMVPYTVIDHGEDVRVQVQENGVGIFS